MFLILWWAMFVSSHFNTYNYIPFIVSSCIVLAIIIGSAFPDFGNKVTTANYILLPASPLEKFVSQFLLKVVLPSALIVTVFWLDTYWARFFASFGKTGRGAQVMIEKFSYSNIFREMDTTKEWLAVCCSILSLISFMFSTRLFFKKYAAIKTFITGILLFFGFMGIFALFSLIFYPETTSWREPFAFKGYEICENLSNGVLYGICLASVSWIFFLLTGYYKFKEKQV
jgi:hypothetical protein